jgi:DNA-directed RNA polymerase specialized sigma24 family protein
VAHHRGKSEALRLDRRDRRDRQLVSGEELPDRCQSLTHAEAFAALQVVASLPARQRELIGLQVAGYSRHEIALLTGSSQPAVERHLRRARAVLRDA